MKNILGGNHHEPIHNAFRMRGEEMKHLGDITKINGAEIEVVDVITGGSPCQDYAEEIVIPKSLHRVL